MTKIGWVSPWDNIAVPADRMGIAVENVKKLQRIIAGRKAFLAATDPDNRTFLSDGGNWNIDGSVGHVDLHALMLRHGYEGLNRLRWFTQCLSGYSSLLMEAGPGSPYVDCGASADEYYVVFPLLENRRQPLTRDLAAQIATEKLEDSEKWLRLWSNLRQTVPDSLCLTFPPIAGESGFEYDSLKIVNYEAYYFLRILSIMHREGLFEHAENGRIIEIGSGFGALVYGLQRHLKQTAFYLVDLPESLIFSAAYLSMATDRSVRVISSADDLDGNVDIACIPNTIFRACLDAIGSVDLAINTYSMNEMGPHQVDAYGIMLSRLIGTSGIFFEMNDAEAHCNVSAAAQILPQHFSQRQLLPKDQFVRDVDTSITNVWSNG